MLRLGSEFYLIQSENPAAPHFVVNKIMNFFGGLRRNQRDGAEQDYGNLWDYVVEGEDIGYVFFSNYLFML